MAGGGRRKRSKQKKSNLRPKDHFPSHSQNESPLSEELTALSAIFQDDFTIISEEDSYTECSIVLQPLGGDSQSNVAGELFIRCLAGYPYKPPKLFVKAKHGISEDELQALHSLLIDQATSISREGRVMIYNLVEAAQEFLSEHVRSNLLHAHEVNDQTDEPIHASHAGVSEISEYAIQDLESSLVYGVMDLFTELGIESNWEGELQQPVQKGLEKFSGNLFLGRQGSFEELNTLAHNKGSQKPLLFGLDSRTLKLQGLNNKNDADGGINTLKPIQFSSVSELIQKVYGKLDPKCEESSSSSDSFLQSKCNVSLAEADKSIQKDFLLAHLLRLVCSPRGPLPHAWPLLLSQLENLDIVPQIILDLVSGQPQQFDLAFREVFADILQETNLSSGGLTATNNFWNANPEMANRDENGHANTFSRYSNDFEELSLLGKGGFGYVVLCKNKLDGRHYAMKKIRLSDKSPSLNNKILREVTTLSRLQHHHIVRYYQAWFESVVGVMNIQSSGMEASNYSESENLDLSFKPLVIKGAASCDFEENLEERTYLYIQMEYCPRTLREILDETEESLDDVASWRIFRQIVEGLAHIHGQKIIHRDLTPNNIFFDVCHAIKIGDFGLAKFTSLEQPDKEPLLSDTNMGSLDGTGQVGTYFYTAPEVAQGWPTIDEKVDMYSLGVILFELWHPFKTAMERYITLNDLKTKGLPQSWALEYPQQAALVQSLMSANPADRPSAMHVLRNCLPPRMEDEALYDVLRTIQRAENSFVIDQIMSALFDQERISLIAQNLNRAQLTYSCTERSLRQDRVLEIAEDVFSSHGAKGFKSSSMSLIDDRHLLQRNQMVTMIDSAGRMLEVRSEMRRRFVYWVVANEVISYKHFEISQVYRKAAGPNPPEEYYQGDFDIIGDSLGLAEAETIKVAIDILSRCINSNLYEIHINHTSILEAIWTWSGVKKHERKDVAKILATAGCTPPQSSDRKSKWFYIRQQLVQGLQLQESVVDRLQTVERRWNGVADVALSRLRGGLAESALISSAIDELEAFQSYLRVWNVGKDIHGYWKHVHVDALMVPVEQYQEGIFFQVYIRKGSCIATASAGMLVANGGRYDKLLQKHWTSSSGISAPGAVGISIALEKIFLVSAAEGNEAHSEIEVLVCSKGGGGLLRERMEVVSELWDADVKANFLHSPSPSQTEQYDYANKHGIKWLIMLTEADLLKNIVQVRNMESRKAETIGREVVVKFFMDKKYRASSFSK